MLERDYQQTSGSVKTSGVTPPPADEISGWGPHKNGAPERPHKSEDPSRLSAKGVRRFRRRPTLPQGLPSSTIGAGGLNYCVRNGYRCDPSAITTETSVAPGRTGAEFGTWHRAGFCRPASVASDRIADYESQVLIPWTLNRNGRWKMHPCRFLMAKSHG